MQLLSLLTLSLSTCCLMPVNSWSTWWFLQSALTRDKLRREWRAERNREREEDGDADEKSLRNCELSPYCAPMRQVFDSQPGVKCAFCCTYITSLSSPAVSKAISDDIGDAASEDACDRFKVRPRSQHSVADVKCSGGWVEFCILCRVCSGTFTLWGVLAAVSEDVDLVDGAVRLKQFLQLLLWPGARNLTHKHLDGVRVGLVRVLQRSVHLAGCAVAAGGSRGRTLAGGRVVIGGNSKYTLDVVVVKTRRHRLTRKNLVIETRLRNITLSAKKQNQHETLHINEKKDYNLF